MRRTLPVWHFRAKAEDGYVAVAVVGHEDIADNLDRLLILVGLIRILKTSKLES